MIWAPLRIVHWFCQNVYAFVWLDNLQFWSDWQGTNWHWSSGLQKLVFHHNFEDCSLRYRSNLHFFPNLFHVFQGFFSFFLQVRHIKIMHFCIRSTFFKRKKPSWVKVRQHWKFFIFLSGNFMIKIYRTRAHISIARV